MDKIKIFAPATIANVGPGYDIFGLALENIGDTIEMQWTDKKGIHIHPIDGFPDLPTTAEENIAGIVAIEMLKQQKIKRGLDIRIHKNVMPGSGLGSSGSSAAGAAFALNELLGKPFSQTELIQFAMLGEKATSGKAHADNVAASILGGFTIIKGYEPLQVFNIPFPENLHIAIVHPQIEVKTSDSKKVLKKELGLDAVIKQCGNVAGLVAGMMGNDFTLIGASMNDLIAEPIRSFLIPGYKEAKKLALENGAIGCSISGSGPSIFAFTEGKIKAEEIALLFANFYNNLGIANKVYCSGINGNGCEVL
ncbi:homoserine kinase [Marivirga sp. S37H4]|uniref:Homoserine kinase n=1 Tax=Marivirga aurantiaca TaxID=2802615 RepID=A0A934X0V2_9BACT|nr:homoserine kinase [Marivirga aurantiaca]MBK6266614.1 homoserine kinase [Marivirga aurantiaca]